LASWGDITVAIAADVPSGDSLPQPPQPPPGKAVTELQWQQHAEKVKVHEAAVDKVLQQYRSATEAFQQKYAGEPITWIVELEDIVQPKGTEFLSMVFRSEEAGPIGAKAPLEKKADFEKNKKGQFVKVSGRLSGCNVDITAKDRYSSNTLAWMKYVRTHFGVTIEVDEVKPVTVALAAVFNTGPPVNLDVSFVYRPHHILESLMSPLTEKDRLLVLLALDPIKRLPANELTPATEKNRNVVSQGMVPITGSYKKALIVPAVSQAMSAINTTSTDVRLLVIFASELDARECDEIGRLLPAKPGKMRIRLWMNDKGLGLLPQKFLKQLEAAGGQIRLY
jgi:hypothetical protein